MYILHFKEKSDNKNNLKVLKGSLCIIVDTLHWPKIRSTFKYISTIIMFLLFNP